MKIEFTVENTQDISDYFQSLYWQTKIQAEMQEFYLNINWRQWADSKGLSIEELCN